MKLDPKTFLAIDSTISAVIDAAYAPVADAFIAKLAPLIEDEKWASCHFAADQLDLSGVVASCRPRLQELAVAALLFGAHKQSGDITKTRYARDAIPLELHRALDQMEHAIEQDAAHQLRELIHDAIDEISERVPLAKAYEDDDPSWDGFDALKVPTGRRTSFPAGYSFDKDYPGDALVYDNPRYQLQVGIGARPQLPNQPFETSVSGKEMLVGPSVVATSPNGYLVALGPWEGSERPLGGSYGYDGDVGLHADSLRAGRLSYLDPEDLRDRVPRYLSRDQDSLRPSVGGRSNSPTPRSYDALRETRTIQSTTRLLNDRPSRSSLSLFKADDGSEPCGCDVCNQLHKAEPVSFRKATAAEYAQKLNFAVRGQGKALIDIGATMTTSRLINYGFLAQADSDGSTSFMISAVLDDRTCPVCQFMDGKIFSVDAALGHTTTTLGISDPADLKSAAPWPKQDKASIAALYGMSNAEIMANGWFCPYHPNCRCTPERLEDQAHLQGTSDNLTALGYDQDGNMVPGGKQVEEEAKPAEIVSGIGTLDELPDPIEIEHSPGTKIIVDDELRERVEQLDESQQAKVIDAFKDEDKESIKALLEAFGIPYDEDQLTFE